MQKLIFYPDKLYEIRTKARITQDELAKAVGVSRTTFSKLLRSHERSINPVQALLVLCLLSPAFQYISL